MELFGDFCLVCDRQTNGSPFCSQTCRLAELDQSRSSSECSSPSSSCQPSPRQKSFAAHKGLQLTPAIDFAILQRGSDQGVKKRSRLAADTGIMDCGSKIASTPSVHETTTHLPSPVRCPSLGPAFTPSSSSSSLTSLPTNHSASERISERAWTELNGYANNFDPVRSLRRRMSAL